MNGDSCIGNTPTLTQGMIGNLPRCGRADRARVLPTTLQARWAAELDSIVKGLFRSSGTVAASLATVGVWHRIWALASENHLPSGLSSCHSLLPGRGAMKVCTREGVSQNDLGHGGAKDRIPSSKPPT